MTKERWIEYQGRYFTPLELQEFIAENLPEKQKRVFKLTVDGIKRTEDGIVQSQKLLESSKFLLEKLPKDQRELIKSTEQRIKLTEESIARDREFVQKQRAFLKVLLAAAPLGEELAKLAKNEVDSLK